MKSNNKRENKPKSYDFKDYLVHGVYFSLYGLVKYIPSPIGDPFRYILTKIFMKKLGKTRIYEGVTFWYPYRINIGDNVTINEWVYLSGFGGIKISNGVRIGHRTSIITSDHIFNKRDIPIYKQGIAAKGVSIHEDVFIGCNVTILGGVTIGKGAVIGSGSVVTKDVNEYSIVAGVPAKQIGVRGLLE